MAGGKTVRVATTGMITPAWRSTCLAGAYGDVREWRLDLNQAFSASGFHDVNDVYLVSWAPTLSCFAGNTGADFYPYFQAGFGLALLSEDNFESEDNDLRHTGNLIWVHGQFESSLALGVIRGRFGMRVRGTTIPTLIYPGL